jgi:hypothetical protein
MDRTGHATMASFMRQLRALARTFNLTIIVRCLLDKCSPGICLLVLQVLNGTALMSGGGPSAQGRIMSNPQSAFASTIRKPALGPSFAFMSDCTLWLQRFEGRLKTSAEEEMDRYWEELGDHHGVLNDAETNVKGPVIVAEVFKSRFTVRIDYFKLY